MLSSLMVLMPGYIAYEVAGELSSSNLTSKARLGKAEKLR